ncbi:putative glycosyltransferase [gamma proteobacterium IMCC1989]|nr:putative glycosyltransferase [gamma proteobacterium IMCC1989]
MSRKKQILFVHQNFPGQYRYLARHYAEEPSWDVFAIGERECVKRQFALIPKNITVLGYDMPPVKNSGVSSRVKDFVRHVDRADALETVLLRQKENGLSPDVILAHPGWGEAMYLKEIFPQAKLICFFEYYFNTTKNNIDFDPMLSSSLNQKVHYRMSNTASLISLSAADVGVSPTQWQLSTFPRVYRQGIHVIHDGVDTTTVKPSETGSIELTTIDNRKVRLSSDDEIVSYSVRNLEPSRGFHRYMEALPALQKKRPNAYFVIVGGDEKSYSGAHASGKSWREVMLNEVGDQLVMDRVLFVGKIPYATLLDLFSITSLHIYMTSPFVLSWSMMEAMACEAPILASRTEPVKEVIKDNENGVLFDYFSADDLVKKANGLLENDLLREKISAEARDYIVKNYDLHSVCLPQYTKLIEGDV